MEASGSFQQVAGVNPFSGNQYDPTPSSSENFLGDKGLVLGHQYDRPHLSIPADTPQLQTSSTPRWNVPAYNGAGDTTPPMMPMQAWQGAAPPDMVPLEQPVGKSLAGNEFDIRQGLPQDSTQYRQFSPQQMPMFTMQNVMGYAQNFYPVGMIIEPMMQAPIDFMHDGRRRERRGKSDVPSEHASLALQNLRSHGERAVSGDELLENGLEFAQDSAGSKRLQHVVASGPADWNVQLAQVLQMDVLRLTLHPHGCRVVQKLLEELPTAAQVVFCSGLRGHVVQCVESQHGNHVIQKVVERLPPQSAQFVLDEVCSSIEMLCPHVFGCRVVQRILEHSIAQQTDTILEHILEQLFTLCREQYGNYVVQHVLEHGRDKDKTRVVALIQEHASDLACHKYGSNVVEKALLLANATERRQVAASLFGSPIDPQRLEHLVQDRFANYVIQRVLEVADPALRSEMSRLLDGVRDWQQSSKNIWPKGKLRSA
jgi:pumilio RNA-binding family